MSDLRFQLLGVPVTVMPSFLLLVGIYALFGLSGGASTTQIVATGSFVVLAFTSILVHELGHAAAARGYGLGPAEILIHGFGGLTRYQASETPLQSLWISLAGPGVNVAIGLAAIGIRAFFGPLDPYWQIAYEQLLFVNLGWAVFNLLPLFPLDGGQALGAALNLVLPGDQAWPITWWTGLVGGVLVALAALRFESIFVLFIAGSVASANWQALKGYRARRRPA